MNFEPLMDALVEAIFFLELGDSSAVDEDAAVEVLEYIASALQRLGPAEKRVFLGYLQKRAGSGEVGSKKVSDLISRLPSGLGLDDG